VGLMDIFNRSFHVTQPQFDQIVKEYSAMGFQKAHITRAWQKSNKNINQFHDVLI
jgi:alpha-mannosidase